MENNLTHYSHFVEFVDVDATQQIRLPDLLSYILLASEQGETELGVGVDMLRERYNAGWVLSRLTILLRRLPRYMDELQIDTWPTRVAHGMVFREYRLRVVRAGRTIETGQGSAVWSIIDLDNRQQSSKPFADDLWANHFSEHTFALPRLRHPSAIPNPTHRLSHQIHYTDIDLNGHCNSSKYLQFMLNACDDLASCAPVLMDIRFVREVHRDETVSVEVQATDRQTEYILRTENGQVACTAVLTTDGTNFQIPYYI